MSRDHLTKRVLRGAIITTLTGVALTALVAPATAQSTWRLQAKMEYPDRPQFARSDGGVSLSGNRAVIGDSGNSSTEGAAYVYDRIWGSWVETDELVASDGAFEDYFGYSVSVSGDRVLIGAYGDYDNGPGSGSAYVFERINGTWVEVAKLTASDGIATDHFGLSVSLSGNRAVIGAPSHDFPNGAAYIFEDFGPGRGWSQVAKLQGEDTSRVGGSVSVSGDRVLVGGAGAADLYELTGGVWTLTQRLVADDAPTSFFARSVSLSGNRALIGVPGDDDLGPNSGAAYVFQKRRRRHPYQQPWVQVAKLTASDGEPYGQFGWNVSLLGDRALLGAPWDDELGLNSGAAYVFERINGSWLEQAKLTQPGITLFGFSLSLGADRALIGCIDPDFGAAYIFSTP